MELDLDDDTIDMIGIAVVVSIIISLIVGAVIYSDLSPRTAYYTTTVYSSTYVTYITENPGLTEQVSSLSSQVSQLKTSITSLESSATQQAANPAFVSFAIYELLKDSVAGSSVVVQCASQPITNLVLQYTGKDISSNVSSLIQTSLLSTSSFQLTNSSLVSQDIYRANGTVDIGVTVSVLQLPIHEPVSVTALVDISVRSVSGLRCLSVGTPTLG